MKYLKTEIIKLARTETHPSIPRKVCWKAKIFGKQMILDYLWNYYQRESETRIPFYLPYIYMKENFNYLRRYGKIARDQISMILIDGNDERTDYFLETFLEELNYLTIVTERKGYFEGLQERAFQELGLLIDLATTWETKKLRGNMVWDFTKELQPADCYPKSSICFVPHKDSWKIRELLKNGEKLTAVSLQNVEIQKECIGTNFAETLLVPPKFPFRKSRCEELKEWCRRQKWNIKLNVQTLENP